MTKVDVPALAKAIRGEVSQRHWAIRLGISRDVISRTETGSRLNRPYLAILAELPGPEALQLKELLQDLPEGRGAWMKERPTISKIAAEVVQRRNIAILTSQDVSVLDEIASKAIVSKAIASKAGGHRQAVLDGLKRDPARWTKVSVEGLNSQGYKCRRRGFLLKEQRHE
ncbi:MAG: hypothetical protein O3A14_19345 [Cyanobacteria bacterium]|nr:hypothetical protein [Cyanobacteriota bacterium]